MKCKVYGIGIYINNLYVYRHGVVQCFYEIGSNDVWAADFFVCLHVRLFVHSSLRPLKNVTRGVRRTEQP